MVIECKTRELFKTLISENKYCIVLIGTKGCNSCAGMIPVLEEVYQIYPFLTFMIVPEPIIREYTRPLNVHATSVLFFKNGVRQALIKRSRAPRSYIVHIDRMLVDENANAR